MARATRPIHYLLVFCIGFMPAFNLAAADEQHEDAMPASCLDCNPMEMAADLPCDSDECMSIMHACGPCASIGFIPVNLPDLYNQTPRLISYLPAYIKFGSHSGDSIYRPPIA